MAKMIVAAVTASATVPPNTGKVTFELLESCNIPLENLNKKTPGINDTTEAKPMAANGIR